MTDISYRVWSINSLTETIRKSKPTLTLSCLNHPQSGLLRRPGNDPSSIAKARCIPASPPMTTHSILLVALPKSPPLSQIFAPWASFSVWRRMRSHRVLNLVSRSNGVQQPCCYWPKIDRSLGGMWRSTVVLEEPGLLAKLAWLLLFYILPQVPQNFHVEVCTDCLTRKNKLLVS